MSSKFPLVVIMTELAERLRRWDLDLNLDWIPRNQNEEADGLTNGVTSPFAADLEVKVDMKELGLHVLDHMWEVAHDLYKDVKEKRAQRREEDARRKGRATSVTSPRPNIRPLRERDPW